MFSGKKSKKTVAERIAKKFCIGTSKIKQKRLTFVTGNKAKLNEATAFLNKFMPELEVENIDIDLPELQGDMEEISRAKALLAYQSVGRPIIVEDTSLCCKALNGMPGPYIKWFGTSSGSHKYAGLRTMLESFQNFRAEAVTVFSLYDGGKSGKIMKGQPLTFMGRMNGNIVEPRGEPGHGWGSVFVPDDGDGRTITELSTVEKNMISQRARSLESLGQYLKQIYFK